MMKQCVVVIPLYKKVPSEVEAASFRQGLNVLKSHDICVVTHSELDLSAYVAISKDCGKDFSVELFDEYYFKSVQGYNRLCYSKQFYQRFADYEYMLIYQTDAWVFRDELDMWCKKGYDYIGAPLFMHRYDSETNKTVTTKEIRGVGNGGFSLRRVAYCLSWLNKSCMLPVLKPSFLYSLYMMRAYNKVGLSLFFCKVYYAILTSLGMVGFHNNRRYFIRKNLNEDYYYSIYAQNGISIANVNIPQPEVAMYFAFEENPSYLFLLTTCLPFGCHAFEKYDYKDFWKSKIDLQ